MSISTETKYKKITKDQVIQLEQIEESCYKTMEKAINHVNCTCTPLIKTISPHVANVQMHLNLFEERNQKDLDLPIMRLINYNLCLNAEPVQAHTECDSSYTVICVPNQITKKKKRMGGKQ